ncbi:flavodoxin family protein [Qiania dongpingensis]|uniref:Flavodoxin family protein n=1 Tax=Qiania dongpingensis TaxID=2763669 RepID=A0A7G9G2M0_9FIRM|nr:flavodoxin family protein [Qiania dongpingensis]QNM05052.1 flavodoxin family protein [Qiania dongpingensis]
MKITILYYSETGNTEKMAMFVKEGILSQAPEAEVELMNLKDEDSMNVEFLNASEAVVFGTPCYVANLCWQMKKFFDTRWDCKLADKLAACFATANCMWGGADIAIQTVLQHAMTRGMFSYASGAGNGRPFIHLGPIALRDELEEKADLFRIFGRRVAEKTEKYFVKH